MIQLNSYSNDIVALHLFLEAHFMPPISSYKSPKIIIGDTPDNFNLVTGNNSIDVIGSTIQEDGHTDVLLKSSLSMETSQQIYHTMLLEQGWQTKKNPWHTQSGFVQSKNMQSAFCNEDLSLVLNLLIREWKNMSLIRISLQPETQPCRDIQTHSYHYARIIPELSAPANSQMWHTRQQNGANKNQGKYALSATNINTHISISELADHYTNLLQNHTWQRVGLQQADTFISSIWHFEYDEELWTASLIIKPLRTNNESYNLMIYANNL